MTKLSRIAVFTSIRSEYGLLSPLIKKLHEDSSFELQLLVGGAHLLKEYGFTIEEIKRDGFPIRKIFDFLSTAKTADMITRSMSILQKQIGEYFVEDRPDLLIVMGDRFELLPVASACLVYNIPIAHISGGEITEGAQDNQVRHALTKLSHIHFPATQEYKENIIKMGEEEGRVFVSGEPGLDILNDIKYIPKNKLYHDLGLDSDLKVIISTFHPETITNKITPDFVKTVFENILKKTDYQVLVTAANFDQGGMEINEMLSSLSQSRKRISYVKSLGQVRYYSLLKYADLMLGNSSSGILEAQSFNLPVVNVGQRQEGRTTNPNVHSVDINVDQILKAISFVLSKEFRNEYWGKSNLFGDGNACARIIDHLRSISNYEKLIYKKTVFA